MCGMADVMFFVLGVVPLVLVPLGFARAVVRARRRRLGGGVLGPFQEMWDPGAARTELEVRVQSELRAPAPLPDDPPLPGHRTRRGRGA